MLLVLYKTSKNWVFRGSIPALIVDACDDGGDRPLDEERLRRLRVNRSQLTDLLETRHGLLGDLYSVGCITQQQMSAVSELNSSQAEKNRKLLDILTRRSVAHFDLFLACLRRNSQAHIANFLQHGGGKNLVRFLIL